MTLENLIKKAKKEIAVAGLAAVLALGAAGPVSGQVLTPQDQKKHFFECEDIYYGSNIHDMKISNASSFFSGIGHKFKITDAITYLGYDPAWNQYDNIKIEISGPSGELVYAFNFKEDPKYIDIPWRITNWPTTRELVNSVDGGYGQYKIIWYKNSEKEGEDSFSISDN